MRIKDMNKAERPREKAKRYGLDSLDDAELIALILGHGIKNYSALDLARSLLSRYTIEELFQLSYGEWKKEKGFQDPQIWRFLATYELIKRMVKQTSSSDIKLTTENVIKKYQLELRDCPQETLIVVMGNHHRRLITEKVLLKGTSNELLLSINDLFSLLIRQNARCFILIHNHPSNNPLPSKADYETTLEIIKQSKLLHLKLIDHIILCKEGYYSFLEADII